MKKISKPEYLEKVKQLSKVEMERLLSRMGGKLPRWLQKEKLSQQEALAIQMELEDEQLASWRKMIRVLREKEAAKERKRAKSPEKAKATAGVKSTAKPKPTAKAKAPAKPKPTAKAKAAKGK